MAGINQCRQTNLKRKEMTMNAERKTKIVIYVLITIVAAILAVHCSNVLRHASFNRLLSNNGHSEWVYRARFYFLVLTGIGIIITQNVFIYKALKRKED